MRSYHGWWTRFNEPDPWDGSYDLTDPQSFNRYSYCENDPVNFVDPMGMFRQGPCRSGYDYATGACRDTDGGGGGVNWLLWRFYFGSSPQPSISDDWSGGGGGAPAPVPIQNEVVKYRKCGDFFPLPDANTDQGALARLLYAEATDRSYEGYFSEDHWNEMYAIAATVLNRVAYLNTAGLKQSQTRGWGHPGASIADVVYSGGQNPNGRTPVAIQYDGFTPRGVASRIEQRITRAIDFDGASPECRKLLHAISIAQLGMAARSFDPFGGLTVGMRTVGHGSPGRNYYKLGQFGRNVFFGLR